MSHSRASQDVLFSRADQGQPSLPRRPRRRDGVRMDRQDLPEHAAGAYHHECRVRQEDARAKVQLSRHRRVESLAREGARYTGLWRRRISQHDMRRERTR